MYYRINYRKFRWHPIQSEIVKAKSVSDAKLYAYSVLEAFDVTSIVKTTKPK